MQNNFDELFELLALSNERCAALIDTLRMERKLLVEFKTDDLLQLNSDKDQGLRELIQIRKQLRTALVRKLGVEKMSDATDRFPESVRGVWLTELRRWQQLWNQLQGECRVNHDFIEHSLKSLGNLVDNLKRLFGEQNLYSSKGTQSTQPIQGRVVEGQA